MRPSGKVNFIVLLLLGAAVVGVWWLVTFGPVYLDNLDVKEAVSAAHGQWGIRSERAIRGGILGKLNAIKLGWHWQEDEFGERVKVGGLGIEEEDIFLEADETTKEVTVRVTYDREVDMKPLKRTKIIHFVVEKSGPYEH